eukprot:356295-Chlamydomonas_euryale.AAC.28
MGGCRCDPAPAREGLDDAVHTPHAAPLLHRTAQPSWQRPSLQPCPPFLTRLCPSLCSPLLHFPVASIDCASRSVPFSAPPCPRSESRRRPPCPWLAHQSPLPPPQNAHTIRPHGWPHDEGRPAPRHAPPPHGTPAALPIAIAVSCCRAVNRGVGSAVRAGRWPPQLHDSSRRFFVDAGKCRPEGGEMKEMHIPG